MLYYFFGLITGLFICLVFDNYPHLKQSLNDDMKSKDKDIL